MPLRKRAWLGMGGVALASAGFILGAGRLMADGEPSRGPGASPAPAEAPTQAPGAVSQAELGNLIRAMGAEVKLDDKRFDFSFPARYAKEEWNLSMSAVLSENGNAIWVMAWLDPCPRTALEVPRTSLLKLLAKNDTLGNGKFFAYIPANNRFVLERVVAERKHLDREVPRGPAGPGGRRRRDVSVLVGRQLETARGRTRRKQHAAERLANRAVAARHRTAGA